jgi:hypothetical protein
LHQGVFRPLDYVGFHLKEWFQKGLNGVGKKIMPKVVQKVSLFRLWLRLLHVVVAIILIVCLVVFAVA